MSLKEALDFFDKVDALNYECAERIAVGTDHYKWLLEAVRQAVKDLELLDEAAAHLSWIGYGDKYERECAAKFIDKMEAYSVRSNRNKP